MTDAASDGASHDIDKRTQLVRNSGRTECNTTDSTLGLIPIFMIGQRYSIVSHETKSESYYKNKRA